MLKSILNIGRNKLHLGFHDIHQVVTRSNFSVYFVIVILVCNCRNERNNIEKSE